MVLWCPLRAARWSGVCRRVWQVMRLGWVLTNMRTTCTQKRSHVSRMKDEDEGFEEEPTSVWNHSLLSKYWRAFIIVNSDVPSSVKKFDRGRDRGESTLSTSAEDEILLQLILKQHIQLGLLHICFLRPVNQPERSIRFLSRLIVDGAFNNSTAHFLESLHALCVSLCGICVYMVNFCPVLVTSLCSSSLHRRDFPSL